MKTSKLGAAVMSAAILTTMLSLTAAGVSGAGGAADEAAVTSDTSEEAGDSAPAEDDGAQESPYSLPQYDIEAARSKNASFVLTRAGNLDLYSVLGENYGRLAKVRGIFGWTPAADTTVDYGWNGGAGLADTTLSDGKVWYQGAEFGTANANSGNFDRLAAIQTIIDISGDPIAALGRPDDSGAFIPGTVKIETWWVSQTSPYLLALIFEDESGETLASLEFPEQTALWADAVTEAGGRETALSTLKDMLREESFELAALNELTADGEPEGAADGTPAQSAESSGVSAGGEAVPAEHSDMPGTTAPGADDPESAGAPAETAGSNVRIPGTSPDTPEQSGNAAEEPNPPTGTGTALLAAAAAAVTGLAARKRTERRSRR